MTISTDLLRLLEPTVRPDGVSASSSGRNAHGANSANGANTASGLPAAQGPNPPIESRSFESILGEARQLAEADPTTTQTTLTTRTAHTTNTPSQTEFGTLVDTSESSGEGENASRLAAAKLPGLSVENTSLLELLNAHDTSNGKNGRAVGQSGSIPGVRL